MNPLISIIVPVYKVEEYLDKCVQSLVNQTYKNLEIILVDDGSPDKCPRMCDEWKIRDSRIKVIHKKNGGLSSARNAGMEIASGEYVGFIDSDDTIDKEMYYYLICAMEGNPMIGIVSCMIRRIKNNVISNFRDDWVIKEPRIIYATEFARKIIPTEINHSVCCKLFRANILKEVRFREGRINEDSLFMFDLSRIVENGNWNMLEIPFVGYNYFQREGSISNNINKPLSIDIIENYKEMRDYYQLNRRDDIVKIVDKCIALRSLMLIHNVVGNDNLERRYLEKSKRQLLSIDNVVFLSYKFPILSDLKFFLYKYCLSLMIFLKKIKRRF